MKKVLMLVIISLAIGAAAKAQTEVKVKPTTTPTQKVHNTFSRHKHYKGAKIKATDGDHKTTTKIDAGTGAMKTKND